MAASVGIDLLSNYFFFMSYVDKVAHAIEKLFGEIKYVELPISSPSVSSTPAQ